ncbi:MAG: phosphotransferase [Myxococcota bacterium]
MKELAGREHPVLETSLDWLDRNAPEAPAGISWGDSRLGNIIWQDYRCASVCDWEAVALCPPEADIGWFVMFDRMSFDDLDAKRLEGFPTRAEQVTLESASGRKVADAIDYWSLRRDALRRDHDQAGQPDGPRRHRARGPEHARRERNDRLPRAPARAAGRRDRAEASRIAVACGFGREGVA